MDKIAVRKKARTFIGVLASHDSADRNQALAQVFERAVGDPKTRDILQEFRFVFTGGTYSRLFEGKPAHGDNGKVQHALREETKAFLFDECGVIRLPPTERGGVTILASLISLRRISVLWPFFTPLTTHLLFPENLALLRLADQWRAKKLMNTGSVYEWLRSEGLRDSRLNPQDISLSIQFPGSDTRVDAQPHTTEKYFSFEPPRRFFPDFVQAKSNNNLAQELSSSIVALISHDEMKHRMLDFVTDYEAELGKFSRILATGTTGRLVQEAAPTLAKKVHRYHSGPKGGDIEIATEILFGGCHVVIFFVDPLHPHPHTEDVRVVFGACMIQDQVRMLSNEIQARDWMDTLIRRS